MPTERKNQADDSPRRAKQFPGAGLPARQAPDPRDVDSEVARVRVQRAIGHARGAGLVDPDDVAAYAELFLKLGAGFELREPVRSLLASQPGPLGARLRHVRGAVLATERCGGEP